MVAQAQPKFNSIRDELVALTREANPSEFSLRRIRNQIESLLKVDALHGYILYGMLSAVNNDVAAMDDYHNKALRISPNDQLALMNYAISLSKTGFPLKALEIAKKVLTSNEDDIHVFKEIFRLSFDAGQFSFCLKMLQTIKKLSPDEEEVSRLLEKISGFLNFIESKNINENDITKTIETASSVLRKSGLMAVHRASAYIESDEESSWLFYGFNIGSDLDNLFDINMQLIDKFIEENVNPKILESFIIKFNAA